jgi:hypothetical protein
LNAGQAGAFRASEYIAKKCQDDTMDDAAFAAIAEREMAILQLLQQQPATCDWRAERAEFQQRMSESGSFIRSADKVTEALDGAHKQWQRLYSDGLGGLAPGDLTEALRNRQLCLAHVFYLECILMQIDYIGSRGGSMVLNDSGRPIHPLLSEKWNIQEEKKEMRDYLMVCSRSEYGTPTIGWEKCRPVPETDGWFENIWREFRTGEVYSNGEDHE